MTATNPAVHHAPTQWCPIIDPRVYDRRPSLDVRERDALAAIVTRHELSPPSQVGRWPRQIHTHLARLLKPIDDVLVYVDPDHDVDRRMARLAIIRSMHHEASAFWEWNRDQWIRAAEMTDHDYRQLVVAVGYMLANQRTIHVAFPGFKRRLFAGRIFGRTTVDESISRLQNRLDGLGFSKTLGGWPLVNALCELMLRQESPLLDDICADPTAFVELRKDQPSLRFGVRQLARGLEAMGLLAASPFPIDIPGDEWLSRTAAARADVPAEWTEWSDRWFNTSVLATRTRRHMYYLLLKAGRWLADVHPDKTYPDAWTREVAADWVAAVDRMRLGQWSHAPTTAQFKRNVGKPVAARTKADHIGSLRTFFLDCQEWEWISRRFHPHRAFRVPRSVRALIGPDPRVIADDMWAKLLWAGLNITNEDLPRHAGSHGAAWYPVEMVRAVALVWLFGGLRNDEILRLRTGCIRRQSSDGDAVPADESSSQPICFLDIPAHKTGTAFSKPIDPVVGDAIARWEAVRPEQPQFLDAKTAEMVDLLFAFRGVRLGRAYVNDILIPTLCRKANLPTTDVRGRITSHRARSTIATQLYNAKDPMSLFEIQAWLGHRSPASTQHYAKITPTTLTRAYRDAGYFARNIRTIAVLIDRDVAQSGAPASGTAWQHYDLGHGYCTYDFFEQCPHRMACARCKFYIPKGSTRAQLLESKANLQHMLIDIPLHEDERAAVEDDAAAVESLLARLADVPTPAGPTPRQMVSHTLRTNITLRSVSAGNADDSREPSKERRC